MSSEQITAPSEPRAARQRRLRRAAVAVGCLGLGLVCAIVEVFHSIRIAPWLIQTDLGGYVIPSDIWTPVQAARWVANGALLFIYEAEGARYDYGPLWAVVLAPAVAIGDHLKLVDDSRYGLPQPPMAIPMIMVGVTAAITVLAAGIWRVTAPLASKARWTAIIAMVGPAMVAAGGWFHGEDMLMVGFMLLAAASPAAAAWWTAAALLTKQTILAYAPALFAACEPVRRGRFALIAAGVPAVVMAMILAATPRSLVSGLTGAPTCVECFTPSLWASLVWDDADDITATYGRVVWVVAAVATTWLWRHRCRDVQGLFAVLTAIALMRCLVFEAGVYAYYWVPATIFTLVWSARAERRLWPTLMGFAGLAVWHLADDSVSLALWWTVTAAAASVAWHPVLRSLGRPHLKRSGREPEAATPLAAVG